MEHHSMFSLMLLAAIAFILPIVLQKFNLRFIPVVIAEIMVGIVMGQSGFGIITADPWLTQFSLLGFMYLMFISGLEIDFKQIEFKNKGKLYNPFIVAVCIFLLIFTVSFVLALSLVWLKLVNEPIMMTLIISTISLGVVVPVLKERKLLSTSLGQTILLVTVLSDFLTMILLTVYSMVQKGGLVKLSFLLALFVIVFITYRFIKHFFHIQIFKKLLKGTVQLGTRGVFALMLMFVVLSEYLGAEGILGAFLAGVIVSLLSPKKEFVHHLDSFGFGFLIPVFFIMVGAKLDLVSLITNKQLLLFIPLLLLYMYVAKIVPSLLLLKWHTLREVMSVGVLTTTKLSLVIAASAVANELGIISDEMNGSLILVAVCTCLISPVLFSKLFPQQQEHRKSVSIVGANNATMLISLDLFKENINIRLFSAEQKAIDNYSKFPITNLETLNIKSLDEHHVFSSDVLIFATSNDDLNIEFAHYARELGKKEVIIKVEDEKLHETLFQHGFIVYSTALSTKMLLKTLIDHPSIAGYALNHHESIKKIDVNNMSYHNFPLLKLSMLGNALVLTISRNNELIIPHVHTKIHVGDRLYISGEIGSVETIRRELEGKGKMFTYYYGYNG